MGDRDEQLDRFKAAVDRKAAAAEEASHHAPRPAGAPDAIDGDQPGLDEAGRTQDVRSVRDKNSGHGHKTADKWNQ